MENSSNKHCTPSGLPFSPLKIRVGLDTFWTNTGYLYVRSNVYVYVRLYIYNVYELLPTYCYSTENLNNNAFVYFKIFLLSNIKDSITGYPAQPYFRYLNTVQWIILTFLCMKTPSRCPDSTDLISMALLPHPMICPVPM